MGVGLVGAMVEALRRHNRGWAVRGPRTVPEVEPGAVGPAWELLTHPALLPTVYSPGCEDCPEEPEEVAVRKV